MAKILLTGATGFIGSNILKKIKEANQIFVIQRQSSKKKITYSENTLILISAH